MSGFQQNQATFAAEFDASTPAAVHDSIAVSVVIPAYNCASYIREALDSVFAQTFPEYEVLVVNDGSPDTEMLEAALRPYEARIRYVKQQNRGPSGARNLGISLARGKYVAFLDSDDAWLPGHLATQMTMLRQNPELDLVYGDSVLVRNGKKIGHAFGSEPQHPPLTFEKLLTEECTVGTSSTVALRQSLIDAGGFDERFRCCEDFDLWLRMSFRGSKMNYDPGLHVIHKLAEDTLSGNRYTMKRARIDVYQKTSSTLPVSSSQKQLIQKLIDKNEAECQTDLAKQYLRDGNFDEALEAAQRASVFKRHWKMRATVFGLSTLPRAFRASYRLYGAVLAARNRMRTRSVERNLRLNSSLRPVASSAGVKIANARSAE